MEVTKKLLDSYGLPVELFHKKRIDEQSSEKKRLLLEMARRGEARPLARPNSKEKLKLGRALCYYTNASSDCYDANFDKQIRALAPHWFQVSENKRLLLEMARRGDPKPDKEKTKLGSALARYINKYHNSYDSSFAQQIKELAPFWFANINVQNKHLLLQMARRGDPKPSYETKLGKALSYYISLNGNYDAVLDKEIRELAPFWFMNNF